MSLTAIVTIGDDGRNLTGGSLPRNSRLDDWCGAPSATWLNRISACDGQPVKSVVNAFPVERGAVNQELLAWDLTYNIVRCHQALGYFASLQPLDEKTSVGPISAIPNRGAGASPGP